MTDTEVINKTLYTTFDEVTRMMDFCCEGTEEEKTTSRAFYDWYLKEDTFFIPYGVFVMDGMFPKGSLQKLVCSFNFTDPDKACFTLLNYQTQDILCHYMFFRNENLDMAKINIVMCELHYKEYQKLYHIPIAADPLASKIIKQLRDLKNKKITGENKAEKKRTRDRGIEGIERTLYNMGACQIVRYIYATMYYSSKHQPELVEYQPKEIEIKTGQVLSEYKYTGYVNLNKPVYRPAIKKDPDEPARDYQRHIQKWVVRGHYRRTSKGLIWIEAHEKGEGELEKRIYGTQDESEVNVIPKVFEVIRTASHVPQKETSKNGGHVKSETIKTERPKISIYKRVIDKIKNFVLSIFNT